MTFLLTACGYRGPLYLPEKQAAEQVSDNSEPEVTEYPGTNEPDDEEDNEKGGDSPP